MVLRVFLLLSLLLCTSTASAELLVEGNEYVVASGHPEATAVGLEVLRRGGNVIDAAVATSLALGVAEPYGSGLGGKLILLYRDAETNTVHSIVALCTSPAKLDPEQFAEFSSDKRKFGYHAVGVPGLPAGLFAAHKRWGSLDRAELTEPAAELAERGIEINDTMQELIAPKVKFLARDSEATRLYLVDGKLPPVGARLKNPDYAKVLRDLGSKGPRVFYDGWVAEKIVAAAHAAGAPLSMDDFRTYKLDFSPPISIDYRGYRAYSCPPPLTGGATVLATLKCLEHYPAQEELSGILRLADPMGRILQCLYPHIRDTVADVPTARLDTVKMLSDQAARRFSVRAQQLDPRDPYAKRPEDAAAGIETTSEALVSASTSHLVVADAAGNMVSLTQSLSLHFGASTIAPGTGFCLNDSMSNFATRDKQAVNHVAGGKRARSTIAPMIVTDEGRAWLTLGIPGGQRIPTTTIQLLWRLIDNNQSLAEAFEASRFHLRRPLSSKQSANIVDVEAGVPEKVRQQLEQLGWQVVQRKRNGHYFGGGNAIQFGNGGKMIGVADSRRTNAVAGE